MLQDQPQERRTGHGAPFHLPGLGVAITEAHLSVVTSDDVLLGDDASVKITSQIDQRRLAAADGLAIHHPLRRVAAGKRQSGGLDADQQRRPEDLGQRLVIGQIAAWPPGP